MTFVGFRFRVVLGRRFSPAIVELTLVSPDQRLSERLARVQPSLIRSTLDREAGHRETERRLRLASEGLYNPMPS